MNIFTNGNKRRNRILKLCIIGITAALYIVLELTASIPLGYQLKITFAGLPIILSALILDPVSGLMTGLVGSFISQILKYPLSATTVLWILPAAVRGLSAGLIFKAFKRKDKDLSLKRATVSTTIATIVSSVLVSLLNTFALYVDGNINGYYNPVTFIPDAGIRILSGIITSVVYIVIIVPVLIGVGIIKPEKK